MSFQLNDQQVLQVAQHLYKTMECQGKERLLDLDHLDTFKRKSIKPLYPHKQVKVDGIKKIEKYSCEQICCQLSSGSTFCGCCRPIKPPDEKYQEFGLGVNIYFNFMKHFSCCFIILSILSIIAIGLAYWIALKNEINPNSNYQMFFFSTTMGSFSSNSIKCSYGKVNAQGNQWIANFQLYCPEGYIHYFGPVATEKSESTLVNCKIEREKFQTNDPTYFIQSSSYTVIKDSSCKQQSCKIEVTFNQKPKNNLTIVSYPFACVDPSYQFFDKVKIEISVITYVFVGIDLLITLGFLLFIYSEREGQNKQVEHFKQFQLTLKDFSVKLSGFNSSTFDQQFHELISTISQKQPNFSDHIAQIKTPDDEQYIQMSQNRKQKYDQLLCFMQSNFFDCMINPNQYKNSQGFIENAFSSLQNYLDFKKQLLQMIQNFSNSRKPITKNDKSINVYLVMNSSSDRSLLKKLRQRSCCGKYLITKSGGKYSIGEAPIPDMLQWHNKTKRTFLRVFFSWLITLGIVICSYVLFGWIQWQKNNLLQKYNFSIDCNLFYKPLDLQTFNNTLYSDSQNAYTHCYCIYNFVSLVQTANFSQHCSTWSKNYILYLIIPIIISVGLVSYNIVVSTIFKKLTECQGHFFITNEMFSYVLKRSFILIMNMGLIIVLLNFNYSKDLSPKQLLFLFQGSFKDITSDWYISIGSIIIMTMIFNIISPFLELIMTSVFKCLRKCVDKRCWTRKTSQKYKNDYIKLYSSDVYPIQQRYALIISIFWITMLFNCVIPALNIIAALSIFLMQLVDKLLVFKFFKTPINFDQSLHKKFMKTLYFCVILHLIASAFLLSEPNLIPKNSSFTNFDSFNSKNQRLNTFIKIYYIIPYAGLCILLIVYGLFKQTIIGFLSRCNKKIQRASQYKIRNSQNFLESLSEFQLSKLKTMIEKQIYRLQNLKRNKNLSNQMIDINHTEMLINIKSVRNQESTSSKQINTQISIYKNTYQSVLNCIEFHKNGVKPRKAKLIGMAGYEMTADETQAENQKKILQLDSVLQQIIENKK